ncbi:MAG TPA: CBS domain-containing protein [Gemmatimonadales bacterium]|jgi:CBS domain-containing protein|nr:CBS domain-containing protein [Gemmatimonadales bacterium]
MRVRDLMQREVKTVHPDDSVNDVVVTLTDAHISAVPVVDGTGHMVGVISSTDILTSEAEARDEVEREALFQQMIVRDIMTRRPLAVSPDADVREAAQQMLYAEVHRLFVTEGDKLTGVISTTDIVRAVANGQV